MSSRPDWYCQLLETEEEARARRAARRMMEPRPNPLHRDHNEQQENPMSTINAAGEALARIEHRLQLIAAADEDLKAEMLSHIGAIEQALAALREFIETAAADKARAIGETIGGDAAAPKIALAAE